MPKERTDSGTDYEIGANVLKSVTGPDPRDNFSQKAAKNRKPRFRIGLSEKSALERSEADKSDLRDTSTGSPQSERPVRADPPRRHK